MRFIAFLLFLWTGILGAVQDPVVMLQAVSDKVQSILREREGVISQDPEEIYRVMEPILSTHIDFTEMSRWVIGRSAWQKASSEDQKKFTDAFHILLIRTYAGALISYKDSQIQYMPIRSDIANKKRVQIDSLVQTKGNNPIHVSYRLLLEGAHEWCVYDIVIEGVSLLKGFQSQFIEQLQHNGLNAVTRQIIEHNQQAEQKKAP